jgi:hypothetical protein
MSEFTIERSLRLIANGGGTGMGIDWVRRKAGEGADEIERLRSALSEPKMWALLYLHDWAPPSEGQEHKWEPGKNVFPEISAVFPTEAQAIAARRAKSDPTKYWIRRAHVHKDTGMRLPITPTEPGWKWPLMIGGPIILLVFWFTFAANG